MLCWFFWLGFKQELSFEADLLGIVDCHVHEPGQVIQFTLHVCVVEVVITFAATPEDIVFATKFQRDFQSFLDLSGCESEDIGVAGGCSSVHEARMREHVCCSPQQLDACSLLSGFQSLYDFIEVLVGLCQRVSFGSHIAIMECVVRAAQLVNEFKRGIDSLDGIGDGV